MTIYYFANTRLPTEKAHGLQMTKTAEALARLPNTKVVLLAPSADVRDDLFAYYNLEHNFTLVRLFTIRLIFLGPVGHYLQAFLFALSGLFFILWRGRFDDIAYSRDPVTLFILRASPIARCAEIQALHERLLWKLALGGSVGTVSTNQIKADMLTRQYGIAGTIIAPNGVAAELFFDTPLTREECRKKLGLPLDKKIALYTGNSFLSWKGVNILVDAAAYVRSDTVIMIVGGTDEEHGYYGPKVSETLRLVERQPHPDVPLWLHAADVLVLPNSAITFESQYETSPIKLFEYMASGTPIVASNLPSIAEILAPDDLGILVPPDDPQALARGIIEALANPAESAARARRAREEAHKYTWDARAKRIRDYLEARMVG
jgi:glycosyltransferase involved in cell wall biosynthesis